MLPSRDLNPNLYPLHPTSTYTCGVTTAPRMRSGKILFLLNLLFNEKNKTLNQREHTIILKSLKKKKKKKKHTLRKQNIHNLLDINIMKKTKKFSVFLGTV